MFILYFILIIVTAFVVQNQRLEKRTKDIWLIVLSIIVIIDLISMILKVV